jgi:hypothetical protein
MDRGQVPARDPILHQVAGEALGEQLTTCDDAVLTPRQDSERPVDKCTLCRYMRY